MNPSSEADVIAAIPAFGRLADAAQDLGDSLGSIRLIANLLLSEDHAVPDPMRREYLGALAEKVSRLQGVAEDMAALVKIQARQVALERCSLRASEIVQQAIEANCNEARRRRVVVHHTVSPGEPLIAGDYWKLSRAFAGVLTAMIRATPPGSSIGIDIESLPQEVKIVFRRVGTMAPLDPGVSFFEHETSAAKLGLTLSEELIRMHGGTSQTLDGESGNSVTIRLPAQGV